MVNPTFLATVAEYTHPRYRAKSLGIFRFWRDLGYSIGAILTGVIADTIGINASIILTGALTFVSGIIIQSRMKCREKSLIMFQVRFRNSIHYWVAGRYTGESEALCIFLATFWLHYHVGFTCIVMVVPFPIAESR